MRTRKVTCRAKEDNQTTIKVFKKGYSAKLAGVSRTHKINLGTVFFALLQLHSIKIFSDFLLYHQKNFDIRF